MVITQSRVEISTAFAADFCPAPKTSERLSTTLAVGHEHKIKNDVAGHLPYGSRQVG